MALFGHNPYQLLDGKKCVAYTKVLLFGSAPEGSACRVNECGSGGVGWGYAKFITYTELVKHNFVENDSLCFRISCVTILRQFLLQHKK